MSSGDTGIAVGLKSGFIVTKREKRLRPSQRKGKLGRRVALIREVVREIAGYAPYEKRIMELLKGGGSNPQKRAAKFAKRRLGTHIRAKRKVAEMSTAISKQQQAAKKPIVRATKGAGKKDTKKAPAKKKDTKKAAPKTDDKDKKAAAPKTEEKAAAAPKADDKKAAPKADEKAKKADKPKKADS